MSPIKFCATCRNMLRPIIDDASERLLMCCPSCFYSEDAQQENRQVFSKEFSCESK
ncbi:10350_t:CDS:2 [Diversispora eburnea]|uniref:10350_t:CDS:1 n=1 Tax=Diversispora eburnea TaxID=1213867 RepID=A0A9N9AII5_9GLOM|nr:10350_t:CDS:2 [Diversispora eburnea]